MTHLSDIKMFFLLSPRKVAYTHIKSSGSDSISTHGKEYPDTKLALFPDGIRVLSIRVLPDIFINIFYKNFTENISPIRSIKKQTIGKKYYIKSTV